MNFLQSIVFTTVVVSGVTSEDREFFKFADNAWCMPWGTYIGGDLCRDEETNNLPACQGSDGINSYYLPDDCDLACAQERCGSEPKCVGFTKKKTTPPRFKLKSIIDSFSTGLNSEYECWKDSPAPASCAHDETTRRPCWGTCFPENGGWSCDTQLPNADGILVPGKGERCHSCTDQDCIPYSAKVCEALANQLGVSFDTSDYSIKGCYAYDDGSYSGFYYGTGGNKDTVKSKFKSSSNKYRPHGFDCSSNCVPYSETACKAAADELGFTFERGNYKWTKGCYSYLEGSDAGKVFYGVGGTLEQNKKDTKLSQYRPLGSNCNFDCVPYSETACLEVAKSLNRKLKKGNSWSTKGCYRYIDGYSDEYDQFVYYGTGGDDQAIQVEVTSPKLRPDGYDCQ